MCKMLEDMRNETAAKTAIEIATSLLDSNLSIEDIAKHSGLPVETVKELAAKKKAQ